MKLKEISTWEEHLETILIELKSMINKDEWSTQTSDKLFTLYTICRYFYDILILMHYVLPTVFIL